MTPPSPSAHDRATGPDEPGYAAALDELEAILDELEASDVDVDVLAERVRRAAELLAICRRRIDDARVEVETVVHHLADGPPSATEDEAGGDDGGPDDGENGGPA